MFSQLISRYDAILKTLFDTTLKIQVGVNFFLLPFTSIALTIYPYRVYTSCGDRE